MDLDAAVDELYGLDPADFTARRDALSGEGRRAGDRPLAAAIKGLRRPSAAAFALNLMARARPDELSRLTELGARLREAQAALSGDELRALGRQRQQVIAGLTREARRLAGEAGHRISDPVQREIEATFEAALADEAAGRALSLGRLVRGLERAGMDPVDLEGAVAGSGPSSGDPGPGAGGRRAATSGRERAANPRPREPAAEGERGEDPERAGVAAERARTEARARAEGAAREAEVAAEQAEGRLAAAVDEHERAQHHRAEAEDEVRRRRDELAVAEERADRAVEDERAARKDRLQAEDETETAVALARRARVRADSTGG